MLGILCGLQSEQKIVAGIPGLRVLCAAARPHKARELAHDLIAGGATRLMSFGIAGSLDPSVQLGNIFIGTRVVSKNGQWLCDEAWGQTLVNKIPQAKRGSVYGSEILVPTVADKAALHQYSGCAIVDMESHCAAEVAADAKLPFIVVRAVCDDAMTSVPPLVTAIVPENGRVNICLALSYLLRHPTQVYNAYQVMHDIHKALGALKTIRYCLQ